MEITTELVIIAILSIALIALVLGAYVRFANHPSETPAAHIFLDIETLGVRPDAPVIVVAAYAVDALGRKLAEGTWRVDLTDANLHGTQDPATVNWWADQSKEAQYEAFEAGPRMSLVRALTNLRDLIAPLASEYGGNCYIWGNAPSFDCSILRHAYASVGHNVPWHYGQERDVRTVAWLGEWLGYDAKKFVPFTGTPHIALDDARHQATYTISILNELGGRQ